MSKVFVIGCARTGTMSIETALELIGYKVKPYSDQLVYDVYSLESPIELLKKESKDYTAFRDIPWSTYWKQMYDIYPDAKYILTTRKSADKWLESLTNHTIDFVSQGRKEVLETNRLTYGFRYPAYHKNEFKRFYLEHNLKVRRFFKDKDNFLEMRLSDEKDNWETLCGFLGKDKFNTRFPYNNISKDAYLKRIRMLAKANPEKFFGYKVSEL